MDADTVWSHIDTQRLAFADVLEGLTPEQWATPSLCTGWTVRDVGAHVTMAQSGMRDVIGPMLRARFSFNRMIQDSAVANRLTPAEIPAAIRAMAGSRKKAPGVTMLEPLLDILVHTQDACVPLGIDRPMPTDAALVAIKRSLSYPRPIRLGPTFPRVRFVATDAEWSHGEGDVVEGELRWLLMTVNGRSAVHDRLRGAVEKLG